MSFPARKVRTARSAKRNTLSPSVRDFNEQIIGKYADEDLYIDTVGLRNNDPSVFAQHRSQFAYAYSNHGLPIVNHFPATFNTPRASFIYPDELHRRHVVKSARLRSRLSSNKQHRLHSAGTNGSQSELETFHPSTQLVSSQVNGNTRVETSRADAHQEFIGHQSPRQRPATTHGRYFNSSNGLYTPTSARATSSRFGRPMTANVWVNGSNPWLGTGIQIKKMTLQAKQSDN